MSGSNRLPPACKAGALPCELIPLDAPYCLMCRTALLSYSHQQDRLRGVPGSFMRFYDHMCTGWALPRVIAPWGSVACGRVLVMALGVRLGADGP